MYYLELIFTTSISCSLSLHEIIVHVIICRFSDDIVVIFKIMQQNVLPSAIYTIMCFATEDIYNV